MTAMLSRPEVDDSPAIVVRNTRGVYTEHAALPFPNLTGQVIRHPKTRALAVACNARGEITPQADTQPCYAVIKGGQAHGGHLWLTYNEALRGGWELAADLVALLDVLK